MTVANQNFYTKITFEFSYCIAFLKVWEMGNNRLCVGEMQRVIWNE